VATKDAGPGERARLRDAVRVVVVAAAEQEQTPELRWPLSVFVYDRMRRQDAQAASVLRAVTLPVRRTAWSIDQGAPRRGDAVRRRQPGPAGVRRGSEAGGAHAGPVLVVGAPRAGAADDRLRAHVLRAGVPDRRRRPGVPAEARAAAADTIAQINVAPTAG
jgi:hypothetical protein